MSDTPTDLMDFAQASALLGVSSATLYRWVRERRIVAFKAGRQWRFRRADVEAALQERSSRSDRVAGELKALAESLGGGAVDAGAEAAAALVDRLVATAAERGASDVHVNPSAGGGARIFLRVKGRLAAAGDLGPAGAGRLRDGLVERAGGWPAIEAGGLGRFEARAGGKTLDLRLSYVPAVTGPQLVMRVWDASRITLDMSRIFPRPSDRAAADRLLALPYGLVLVSGPTGSGKTTTAYALLQALAEPGRAVYTVEDPVEVVLGRVAALERVVQVQAGPGFGLAAALRRVLQADPDVVFLADVPDEECARLACQVATSGHLVLAQVHADDPGDAIERFARLAGDPALVASCLAASTGQRLFRRRHADCDGAGCGQCVGGYRGRAAGYDFLFPDRAARAAISRGAWAGPGVAGLAAAGAALAASGETTEEEVERVLGG